MNVNDETRPAEQVEQADQVVDAVAEPAVDTAGNQPATPDTATEQAAQQQETAPTEAEAADSALGQYKSENDSLRSKLLESKAKFAALSLGVSEARIDYAIRLAGLEDIDANSSDADKRIQDALRDVLGQIPEWKAEPKAAPVGTGSLGAGPRWRYGTPDRSNDAKDQFAKGMRR